MLNIQEYQEYISLNETKKIKEKELEEIKKQIADKERLLVENLVNNNMNKLTIGNRTVYINQTTWAKISDKEEAIKILEQEGYGDYIKPTYNSQQVSRLLRDFEENEQPIPSSFKGIIDPVIKTSLNVIKA